MNKKILLIIVISAIIILLLTAWVLFQFFPLGTIAIMEKNEYKFGEEGKIKIKNNYYKTLCFSSCYPYYIEKKEEEGWKEYPYAQCEKDDLIEICVKPGGVKAFKFNFPPLKQGIYRLAIPVCEKCGENKPFKESRKIYSNEFYVNF